MYLIVEKVSSRTEKKKKILVVEKIKISLCETPNSRDRVGRGLDNRTNG